MKNSTKFLFLAAALLIAAGVAMSFGPSHVNSAADYGTSQYYDYTPDQDTITNTEADTLTIPVTLLSSWTASYHVILGNLSGTTNVAVVLQKSNTSSGTDWSTLDTFTGTSGTLTEEYSDVMGKRYRLILTGTGTQSSTYNIYAVFKRKY